MGCIQPKCDISSKREAEMGEPGQAFGERLRVAMAVARLSGQRIASECGVSRQAVHKWESGKSFPNSANLMKVCELTGCSLEWLMWPARLDIRSTEYAPDGVSVKSIIRAVIEDMARDGVLRVAAVSDFQEPR